MSDYDFFKKWKLVFAVLSCGALIPAILMGARASHHQQQVAYQRWGPRLVGTLTKITGPISGSVDNPYVPAIISFTGRNGNPGQTPRPVLVSSHKQVGDTLSVWQNPRNNKVFVAEDLERYTSSPYPSPAGEFVSWLFYIETYPIGLYLHFAHKLRKERRVQQRNEQSKGVTSISSAA